MRSEEEKAESRALVIALMEAGRDIKLGEIKQCVALERLLDRPDASHPDLADQIEQLCREVGIVDPDRREALRRKRAEAEAAVENLDRNIKSVIDHGCLAPDM